MTFPMTFRPTALLLISLCFIPVLTVTPVHGASTVVWYLPHPDDEVIGMADAIRESVLQGNDNYFIFFTRGGNSQARHFLSAPDGSRVTLEPEEFERARVAESLAGLKSLGVAAENVLFLDFPDGGLSEKVVRPVMDAFIRIYPGAKHCTVSSRDPHEDHQVLAKTLASLAFERGGEIRVEYYLVYAQAYSGLLDKSVEERPVRHTQTKQDAIEQYGRWSPSSGRYAVGQQSTPALFRSASEGGVEYVTYEDPSSRSQVGRFELLISNRGATCNRWISERLTLGLNLSGDVSMSISPELTYAWPDDFSFVQLKSGVGYGLANGKWYFISRIEVIDRYFLEMRHFEDASFGAVGIKANLRF